MTGTLPEEIGAWKDMRTFNVPHNNLRGPLPASLVNWKNLEAFDVSGNQLSGGVLPQLPFANMYIPGYTTRCMLFNDSRDYPGCNNSFSCPWPQGATKYCTFNENATGWFPPITDSDCTTPA